MIPVTCNSIRYDVLLSGDYRVGVLRRRGSDVDAVGDGVYKCVLMTTGLYETVTVFNLLFFQQTTTNSMVIIIVLSILSTQ